MASFAELQTHLKTLQFRRQVFLHVAETMEKDFLPDGEGSARMKLLTEEKIAVPESVIDGFVNEMLSEVKAMDEEIQKILSSHVGDVQ